MEQLYSIGTTNRYAMFIDEEDDPGDVILPVSAKTDKEPTVSKITKSDTRENSKANKLAKGKDGKENKDKPSSKQNKATENINKISAPERVNSGVHPKQGSRFNTRGERQGGERLDNRQDRQDRQDRQGGEDRFPSRGGSRGMGGRPRLGSKENDRENVYGGEDRPPRGGRGSRPFRGGGRSGIGQRTGKREFERRSGSDKSSVKAVDKRDGGGSHNWGRQEEATLEDWPTEETEQHPDTQERVTNGEPAATQEDKEKAGREEEGEEEAALEEDLGPKEMTLDEYKAQHRETIKPDSSLQRNVDNSQWKDTIALKKEDAEFFPGTREVIEKPKTSGRVKTTLDQNFYFKDQARRGRGRTPGGRGGGPQREDRADRGERRDRGDRGGFRERGENRRSFDENRREGRGEGRGARGGSRRGSGGGGFGGGGFGGGFGGGRGQGHSNNNFNQKDHVPNVEDESAFPSLGAP